MSDLTADAVDAYYGRATYDRKASGYVLIGDKESACTRMCCHCGAHWVPVKGSRRKYGVCYRCMGYTCGPACVARQYGTCVPYDVYLLILEGKLTGVPIVGRVEAEPPKALILPG